MAALGSVGKACTPPNDKTGQQSRAANSTSSLSKSRSKEKEPQKALAAGPWNVPAVQYFTGPAMLPIVTEELEGLKFSLFAQQYSVDHTGCFVILVKQLTKGVRVRFLLDKGQFFSPSCARQPLRLKEAYDAGAEMRIKRPPAGGFSCSHAKCLICDEKTVLDGSVNMTHNGFENNKEHMYRITEPQVVAEVLEDFGNWWASAEPVTQKEIDEMMEKYTQKEQEKRDKNDDRRSRSLSRGPSRSLSRELETVAE